MGMPFRCPARVAGRSFFFSCVSFISSPTRSSPSSAASSPPPPRVTCSGGQHLSGRWVVAVVRVARRAVSRLAPPRSGSAPPFAAFISAGVSPSPPRPAPCLRCRFGPCVSCHFFSSPFHHHFIIVSMGSVFAPVAAVVGRFGVVGFSGSRSAGPASVAAAAFASSLAASQSVRVAVGCASGVDAAVRQQFSHAAVFSAQSRTAWAFAARSAALVRHVTASSGLLVAFPSVGCPAGLRASRSFSGAGSGTWGSVALAIGSGCAVAVFVPLGASLGSLAHHFAAGASVTASGFAGQWFVHLPSVAVTAPSIGGGVQGSLF